MIDSPEEFESFSSHVRKELYDKIISLIDEGGKSHLSDKAIIFIVRSMVSFHLAALDKSIEKTGNDDVIEMTKKADEGLQEIIK